MRMVFATDLHGYESHHEQLADLVDATAANLLVLGGDLFAYSREVGPQLAFARGPLRRFLEAVRSRVLWIPGNVDWPDAVACLEEISAGKLRLQRLTLDPLVLSDAISVIGYPYIPPSPFRIKHWERRDLSADHATIPDPSFTSTIGRPLQQVPSDFLDSLPSIEEELEGISRAGIWVVHTPPFGGNLDTVGDVAGMRRGDHVGSVAVRRAIERLQPVLTLHGHIHEAPVVSGRWLERIGETVAVNPGQGDQLHAVVVELGADGRLLHIRHTVFGQADLSDLA